MVPIQPDRITDLVRRVKALIEEIERERAQELRQAAAQATSVEPPSGLALTPKEAARALGISNDTVYELIHGGRLRAFRSSEKRFRIPVAEIERFMKEECDRFQSSLAGRAWFGKQRHGHG